MAFLTAEIPQQIHDLIHDPTRKRRDLEDVIDKLVVELCASVARETEKLEAAQTLRDYYVANNDSPPSGLLVPAAVEHLHQTKMKFPGEGIHIRSHAQCIDGAACQCAMDYSMEVLGVLVATSKCVLHNVECRHAAASVAT